MKLPHWTSLAAMAIAISSLVFAAALTFSTEEEEITFGAVPDFELIERSGRTVTRSEMDGRIWIADFIFTNCGGTCPMMTYQMSKLNRELPDEVMLVSITVDPARDTPEALAQYAIKNNVEGDRWLFLIGERDQIYSLVLNGFHLAVDDTIGTEIEPITHSSRFALIDRSGEIRNYYDGTSLEAVDRMIGDVANILD